MVKNCLHSEILVLVHFAHGLDYRNSRAIMWMGDIIASLYGGKPKGGRTKRCRLSLAQFQSLFSAR